MRDNWNQVDRLLLREWGRRCLARRGDRGDDEPVEDVEQITCRWPRRSSLTSGDEVVTITRSSSGTHEDVLAAVAPREAGVVAADLVHPPAVAVLPIAHRIEPADRHRSAGSPGRRLRARPSHDCSTHDSGTICCAAGASPVQIQLAEREHLPRRHQHVVAAEVDALRIARPLREREAERPARGPRWQTATCSCPVAFVRIADSRWVLPVLYSISSPGAANIGRASACRTQSRLVTHAP